MSSLFRPSSLRFSSIIPRSSTSTSTSTGIIVISPKNPRSRNTTTTTTTLITSLHRVFISNTTTTTASTANTRKNAKMSASTQAEAEIKRNPHPDFKSVEDSRPDWDRSQGFNYKKTADPSWTFGDGANSLSSSSSSSSPSSSSTPPSSAQHISIDPYESGRPAPFNYKLLISAIVPRPIGFVSTRSSSSSDSPGALNLAPFSYFNVINHDPPLFALGVASPLAPSSGAKDTLRNLAETRECVVSMIGEDFVEAANATSVDSPPGVSEWDVSGLTPVFDCVDVPGVPRVREAVFSVECRLESVREFESRATPGKKTGCLVVLEGTRFWVREDAVNEERNLVAPEVLRPIGRLGGITYARVTEALELPRPSFEKDVGGLEGVERLKEKAKTRAKAKKAGE